MKDCEICGNEIPDAVMVCRFCKSAQSANASLVKRDRLRTINVKDGMPLVEQGLARLEKEIALAMQSRVAVVRVIHGYGSTGRGGVLRDACRAYLGRLLKAGQISSFLPGEEYSQATNAGRNLIKRCSELRSSERSDSRNPGITFIET